MSLKNSFTWVALAALVSAPLFAGTLTLIQPNGGETYALGETKTIRWTATDVSQNVRLNLLRGGEVVGTIVSGLAASSGHFQWKVGQLTDGTAPVGGNYFIRVRAIDGSEVDQNDQAFAIVAAPLPKGKIRPTLKVEQPNGGESWRLGTEQTIRWSSRFLKGKVHLQLYRHNGAGVGTIADNLPSSGSHAWKAGEILGGMTVAGQYRIRAVAMDNYTVNDMSDGPFDLQPRLADVIGPVNPQLLGKPDLIICAESAVYSPRSTQCTIHVKVRNIGKATAKAGFEVQVQYAGGDPSRIPVVVDILPGDTHMPFYQQPARYDVGDTLITYIVDPDNQVAEEIEGNNQAQCLWSVREGALPPNGPLTCSDGSTL